MDIWGGIPLGGLPAAGRDRIYIYINDDMSILLYHVCLARYRHAPDLPQDRGQERRFKNRRARAGACCVSRVAARPSLCNVALLVQASATRRADRRPSPSGRRMGMGGPQRIFVLVLSSGFRCVHVLHTAFVTQAAFRYKPNYLTNKARGRI